MSWIFAFLGFAALILLHELGHFVAAKAVGMRVERFSVFFPPFIAKRKRGETEYCIGAIPLGGYVKITGMNPNEEIEDEAIKARAYYLQPVWKRIVVIGAGPFVNIVVAFLILWTLFVINGSATQTQKVDSVAAGYPAAQVLVPGDQVISVDGVKGGQSALSLQTATHRCPSDPTQGCKAATAATVVVRRDGALRTFKLTPIYDQNVKRTRMGFSFGVDRQDAGPFKAVELSTVAMWRVSTGTISAIGRIFDAEKRKEISGLVGSYEVTRQSFDFDITQALNVLAIISLSLAIVNLFPFLPLDGGHIFWALAEKVRGRPIPYRVMERASAVGFVLVLMLFAVGLTNDIGRLQGDGFGVR